VLREPAPFFDWVDFHKKQYIAFPPLGQKTGADSDL
jgi:hypothetical protein